MVGHETGQEAVLWINPHVSTSCESELGEGLNAQGPEGTKMSWWEGCRIDVVGCGQLLPHFIAKKPDDSPSCLTTMDVEVDPCHFK
jgi:hypothetical protein